MKVEVILILQLKDHQTDPNLNAIAPLPPISPRAIAVRLEYAASAALLNWTAEVIQAARNKLQVLV